MEPLILTFDVGTQSVRALLAKKDGTFLDVEQYTYEEPYFSDHLYWAEQKPNFYFDALCRVSKNILERNSTAVQQVKAVTLTTIRDTVLCLDKDNKPLRNIIVWLDRRTAKYDPKKIGLFKKIIFKVVGMSDTAESQTEVSVCNWIMQNEPDIWEKTAHYVFLSCYLNMKLTGILTDSVGSTIGHVPFDYKHRRWMNKRGLTRFMMDIPSEKLYPLVEPGKTLGTITKEASELSGIPEGLPLIATGSDKGCETLGLSVRKLGTAAVSFGTSATIQITSEKYIEPQPFLPAYPAAFPKMFNSEIQIYRGYWMLTWFINRFCPEEKERAKMLGISTERLLNTYLKDIPMGSDGLVIQPYWTGGVANPLARGSMVGFNDRQTKYHIYRAIIEGINFDLMGGLKKLEKRSGTTIKEIYVGGGGAKSDEILQITADMFGLPVKRIQTHEACGIGASMVGFVATGEFKDYEEASKSMIRIRDTFQPNEENHQFYERMYNEIYSGMYKSLWPIYKKEKSLFKGRR